MLTIVILLTELVTIAREGLSLLRDYLREQLATAQPTVRAAKAPDPPAPAVRSSDLPVVSSDEELMRVKEVCPYLGIVRSTLNVKINLGELHVYRRPGSEQQKKPRIWLLRTEVELFYKTYTIRKGKDKKPGK